MPFGLDAPELISGVPLGKYKGKWVYANVTKEPLMQSNGMFRRTIRLYVERNEVFTYGLIFFEDYSFSEFRQKFRYYQNTAENYDIIISVLTKSVSRKRSEWRRCIEATADQYYFKHFEEKCENEMSVSELLFGGE